MIDAFVARNLAAFDVGEVVCTAIDEQVDIGVIVGHHKTLCSFVIAYCGDTDIVQSVSLVESCQRVVVEVVAKHAVQGSSIDSVAGIDHMIDQ